MEPGESKVDSDQQDAVFRRVFAVTWELGSKQGAWNLAEDWARRLQAPLQEVSLDDWISRNDHWLEQFQPSDLFICGPDIPSMYQKNLLRETQRKCSHALLSSSWPAMLPTRILVIDQGGRWANNLLSVTAKLCEIFGAGLVALTVARTEQDARERQLQAWEILQGRNVKVNFDFLAGPEAGSAIVNVARWRCCQLVALEPTDASPWVRWLGSAPGPWIMDLLDSLSFLFIPADVDASSEIRFFRHGTCPRSDPSTAEPDGLTASR
jgi:hypothetical protein